jgi:hypothetical protein
MKIEFVIGIITGIIIFQIYTDGKYKYIYKNYAKYIKIIVVIIIAISFYLLIKRDPSKSKNMLLYANNMIKYMPINKSSLDMFTPIIDFTNQQSSSIMEQINDITPSVFSTNTQEQKILSSGKNSNKRSVSETKKKYVASLQNWKCAKCLKQLNAWFEVDHKIRLEYGGGNNVENLEALCRECHGKKTAMENM